MKVLQTRKQHHPGWDGAVDFSFGLIGSGASADTRLWYGCRQMALRTGGGLDPAKGIIDKGYNIAVSVGLGQQQAVIGPY